MAAESFAESPYLLLGTLVVGALGCLVLRLALGGKRRPYSYPGDAVPIEKRLKSDAHFSPGSKLRVDVGWYPHVETQPMEDLLPHKVSGQQVWSFDVVGSKQKGEVFDFDPSVNPNAGDRIFRAARTRAWQGPVPDEAEKPSDPLEAAKKGFAFYQTIQCDDGQWAGDYGGPHFLLPGFVIAAYITAGLTQVLPMAYWRAAEVYVRNHQQADGGWGTHIESPSTMFCSVLNYVALRLLGAPAADPACIKGREFIRKQGGVLYTAPWTKFWLCALGVYDFRGMAPVPPDMWMLPQWFPVHPGRFWCHCRMVYLPMCYIYGLKWSYDAAVDPITSALREELYAEGTEYDKIDWSKHMFSIAEIDNYSPMHWAMKLLMRFFAFYEWTLGPLSFLRGPSLRYVAAYMKAEDNETNYLTIGPVSKALHLLTAWVAAGGKEDPVHARESKEFKAHVARVPSYLWLAEDGLKAQGYNGSMAWDTSFAVQAAAEAGLQKDFPDMCSKAWAWLAREQVRALPNGDWEFWRQPIRGGWGFSTAEQAWPVSDTTAEAFSAVLALRQDECTASMPKFPDEHCFDSVQFLLSYQNADGGWATYENCRGWSWYELLNPAIVFGDIMIDYSYVECTSSSMQALQSFRKQFPDHRAKEIKVAVERGARFIEAMQRDDGSWYGCWGNCFTYGCWFGIDGLLCAGRQPSSCKPIRRCASFLLSKQNADGGWGEDFASCFNREYAQRDKLYGCDSGSTVVCTAWALLALMAAECEDSAAVRKGIGFLMRRQLPSGDWAQENIAGVFNRSVGITYTAFRNVFPLWALGRYATSYRERFGK